MKPISQEDFFEKCEFMFWIELYVIVEEDYMINPLEDWCEHNFQKMWSIVKLEIGSKFMILISSKEDMTFILMKVKCDALEGIGWKAVLAK